MMTPVIERERRYLVESLPDPLPKPKQLEHEFSDVLAWVATLANLVDVDLSVVSERYRNGCPKCGNLPCTC